MSYYTDREGYYNLTDDELALEYQRLKCNYHIFDQNIQDDINFIYNVLFERGVIGKIMTITTDISWTKFGF